MTSLHVEMDQVTTMGAGLADQTQQIQETLDHLIHQVSGVRARWTGEAAQAFEQAHAAWNTQLAAMRSILGGLSACADAGARRYTEADQAVAQLWSL